MNKNNDFFHKQLNFNFLTSNVKGLQSFKKKQLQLFECFKTKICPKGVLFFQERHSSVESEKQWSGKFNFNLYYSHGKTNSCGVLSRLPPPNFYYPHQRFIPPTE